MKGNVDPGRTQAQQVSIAAVVVLGGIILSGPVAVGFVEMFVPQPAWHGVETFIAHYSWIQTLPYAFGFFIAGGLILFAASVPAGELESRRIFRRVALALTSVAAALIFFNYVIQSAFIPLSLRENPALVAAVTMANPNSLGWALEMYGYGILGIATAFLAPLFNGSAQQRMIARLFVLNCIISVLGAVLFSLVPGWVLAPAGMVLGAGWNMLVAVIMVLVLLEYRFGRLD